MDACVYRSPYENEMVASAYKHEIASKYGNIKFDCYYSGDRVILKKRYTSTGVKHALLWPSLGVAVFGTVMAVTLMIVLGVCSNCAHKFCRCTGLPCANCVVSDEITSQSPTMAYLAARADDPGDEEVEVRVA